MKIYRQRWTYMLTSPKKQKMKLLTNLLPTLVFRIWVSPWVSKQKNRLSDIFGEPNFMLSKAIILRLGKQKLVFYRDLYVQSVLRLQL